MNILVCSSLFYPSIGGVETVMSILAHEFVGQGNCVKVVCKTPGEEQRAFPFEIIRFPSTRELYQLVKWCDVCVHACISLKSIWTIFFPRRKHIVIHHTWYLRPNGRRGFLDLLKCVSCFFVTNVAVSRAIASHIPGSCHVIHNPYDDHLFRKLPTVVRDMDLIFLGRLVSDKGAALLVSALDKLRDNNLFPSLTIVGDGPELASLKEQTIQLELDNRVVFAGSKKGEELVEILNHHKIIVIPSLWDEPFGLVALEGMACGCLVVSSSGGGLAEAVGSSGITFENGNLDQLVSILTEVLLDFDTPNHDMCDIERHLNMHKRHIVSKRYLEIIHGVVQ